MQPGQRVVVNQTPFEYMVPFADRGKSWQRFQAGLICPEDGIRGDSVCVRWSLTSAHYPSPAFPLDGVSLLEGFTERTARLLTDEGPSA